MRCFRSISIIFFVLMAISTTLLANENELIKSTSKNDFISDINEVDVGEWELGVAIGLETITNPLKLGENIYLPVVPRVSYYGDNFFIENTDLGYSLFESRMFSINLFGRFNEDIKYFPYAKTTEIFVTSMGWSYGDELGESEEVELLKRHISYLGGVQYHYYHNNYNVKLSLLSDVTDVHHGQEVEFSLRKSWMSSQWLVEFGAGILWKSSSLVNYYYGVQSIEATPSRGDYIAGDSYTNYLVFSYKYVINQDINFLSTVKIDRLGNDLYHSPLVNERYIYSSFIGLTYDF